MIYRRRKTKKLVVSKKELLFLFLPPFQRRTDVRLWYRRSIIVHRRSSVETKITLAVCCFHRDTNNRVGDDSPLGIYSRGYAAQRLTYFSTRFFKSLVHEIMGKQQSRLQISKIKRSFLCRWCNVTCFSSPWHCRCFFLKYQAGEFSSCETGQGREVLFTGFVRGLCDIRHGGFL